MNCTCDHDARDLCANATESRFRLDPSCECECHDGKATLADVLDEMTEDERADFMHAFHE